jgi:hypothetical protein
MLCRSNPTVGSNPTLSVSWGRYSRLLSRYYEVSKDMIAKIKALYDYSIFYRGIWKTSIITVLSSMSVFLRKNLVLYNHMRVQLPSTPLCDL